MFRLTADDPPSVKEFMALGAVTRPGAAPTEEMALEFERELAAARVREGSGAPPRGSPPGTPGREVRRVDPEDGPEPARYRPGVATVSRPLPVVGVKLSMRR